MIDSKESLEAAINEVGVLPFFKNLVPGWSLEEQADRRIWFSSEEGPWEWKGMLASQKRCVYGRFVRGKNAYVSMDIFPDLCNYRRDGYDFEGRCDDGLVPYHDRLLMDYLLQHEPVLSREAKRQCGFAKGFDTVLARLQMQTFVINRDFVYSVDKNGKPYGWGNAQLVTPEQFLGEDLVNAAERYQPEESFERIISQITSGWNWLDEGLLRKAMK